MDGEKTGAVTETVGSTSLFLTEKTICDFNASNVLEPLIFFVSSKTLVHQFTHENRSPPKNWMKLKYTNMKMEIVSHLID